MPTSPWPMRVGALLLREARADDIEPLLAVRSDPGVNRFMLRTHVDPETFRQEWLAVPGSETDFSCVAEFDGQVVAHSQGTRPRPRRSRPGPDGSRRARG